MRLIGLICNCGGAENLIRSIFREAEIRDWIKIPVYKGDKAKMAAKELAEKYANTKDAILLDYYLSNKSGSFVVIVGYDPISQIVKWADVATNDPRSRVEGKIIAQKFA